MGKSRKNQTKSEKRVEKGGQKQSKQTLKRDENPKKVKPENHLEHIPFRLREIIKSKDKVKRGSFGAKKPKKAEQKATARRSKQDDVLNGDIPVPYFKRRRGESERAYIKRMESETKHVVFLTKNQVDRNPELDADKQELPAGKGKSEKKREHDKMRLNRLQQKKLDRQEAKIEKEMFVAVVRGWLHNLVNQCSLTSHATLGLDLGLSFTRNEPVRSMGCSNKCLPPLFPLRRCLLLQGGGAGTRHRRR